MRDEVVSAVLKKQDYYDTNAASSILFGNRDAKIKITVLTNPHCEPCAMMHKRINKLLDKVGDKICVQYIFSSFDKELDDSNKKLIAIYLNHNMYETLAIYDRWFERDKYDKEAFFIQHSENLEDIEIQNEFDAHVRWKEFYKLVATPTVLINGYKLPYEYKIENVEYFTDINDLWL